MFWKEKKEELEVQKTRMGYCPFSGLCRDKEISVVTENAENHVATWFSSQALVIELYGFVSRQGSPCRDNVPRHAGWLGLRQRVFSVATEICRPCVATGFGAGPGLGRDKGLLVS